LNFTRWRYHAFRKRG